MTEMEMRIGNAMMAAVMRFFSLLAKVITGFCNLLLA